MRRRWPASGSPVVAVVVDVARRPHCCLTHTHTHTHTHRRLNGPRRASAATAPPARRGHDRAAAPRSSSAGWKIRRIPSASRLSSVARKRFPRPSFDRRDFVRLPFAFETPGFGRTRWDAWKLCVKRRFRSCGVDSSSSGVRSKSTKTAGGLHRQPHAPNRRNQIDSSIGIASGNNGNGQLLLDGCE